MDSIITLLIILFALFMISAFFSAAEAALIAINKIRLRHMIEKKKPGAQRVFRLVSRMDKLIATLLIGNNLVNTAIASLIAIVAANFFGDETGLLVATAAATILLVIFGDLVPKVFATNHPEGVAFSGRHIVSFLIWALSPVTFILTKISNASIRLMGGNPHHRSPMITEEEIKMMITIGKEEGFYGDNERKMLERIFHFDEIEVRDVMTPINEVVAVSVDMHEEEIERILMEEGHNRIPVFHGTASNIVGMIYVRDLLYIFKNSSLIRLSDIMSAPYFVSPHKKVNELLKDFQRQKIQIAIVRDTATGKCLGLVTLEDLVEEIVGEIEEVQT